MNKEELERYVWISVEELFQNEGIAKFDFGEFLAYIIGDNIVWGLTYIILKDFERLITM